MQYEKQLAPSEGNGQWAGLMLWHVTSYPCLSMFEKHSYTRKIENARLMDAMMRIGRHDYVCLYTIAVQQYNSIFCSDYAHDLMVDLARG